MAVCSNCGEWVVLRGTNMPSVRCNVCGGELGQGLRSPTPQEAEDIVVRAQRLSLNSGMSYGECLEALRDVLGWTSSSGTVAPPASRRLE